MNIEISYCYGFKFTERFQVHNGIYKVLAILSYDELLNMGVDLYAATYEPLGILKIEPVEATNEEVDATPYMSYFNIIKNDSIYKLEKMNQNYETILYIPKYLIDGIPDISVSKYFDLGLAVKLGIFDNAEVVNDIREQIRQLIEAQLGSFDSYSEEINTYTSEDVVVYTVKEKWMTKEEYDSLTTKRSNVKSSNFIIDPEGILPPVSIHNDVWYFTSNDIANNVYNLLIEKNKEINMLKTLVTEYETLIKLISIKEFDENA